MISRSGRSLIALAASLFVVLLAAGRARAADAAAAPRQLTLDDALAMARKANHSLMIGRAQLKQAQTNIDQAFTVLFPTVTAQGKYSRNNKAVSFALGGPVAPTLTIQPLNQLDGIISFSTLVFSPAVHPGLKSIEASYDAVDANVAATEDTILFGVAQAFYSCAVADEVLVARGSSIEVARLTLEKANARFSAGTVTKVDVDRAELALLQVEQAKRDAELGADQAYRALGTLIGADSAFRVVPPPVLAPQPVPTDLDGVLRLRPEFRALEATVRADDLERRAEGWRWAPSLSAFGNARRFNYKNFAQDDYSWVVGASLDWVLYDGGVRDVHRHLAAAQVEEAMARAEVLRDSIRDDLANGQNQFKTKTLAVATAERQVGLARETVDLVRTQYEAGTVTQVDLLQAQDGLVSAQVALAQAHFDVAVADLTVKRAAGAFPGR